jgi:hypothetical protein
LDKKDRNKRKEKNKYGETFSTKEKKFNSPINKKRKPNNWKTFLEFVEEE